MRGGNLVLLTQLTFESSGSCGNCTTLTNPSNCTTLVFCEPNCTVSDGLTYDFEMFGDVTIPNAKEGLYIMGMQRPCPYPSSVLAATYTVTYSCPGKICVHHAYIIIYKV